MNVAEFFLYLIVFLIIILGFVSLIIYFNNKPTDSGLQVPNCDQSTVNLTDLSATPCCQSSLGVCTIVKYDSSILGGAFLAPWPTNYYQVCSSLCPTEYLSNQQCSDPDSSVVEEYNQCIETLKPSNCSGDAVPVGLDGATLYYVTALSETGCDQCSCL